MEEGCLRRTIAAKVARKSAQPNGAWSTKIRPVLSTLTTMPCCEGSGRVAACGRRTSTPPCIMGAAIMKMMRSTNATSTSDVTLMSALSGARARRRDAILDVALAGEGGDELAREPLELAGDVVLPRGEDVVGD